MWKIESQTMDIYRFLPSTLRNEECEKEDCLNTKGSAIHNPIVECGMLKIKIDLNMRVPQSVVHIVKRTYELWKGHVNCRKTVIGAINLIMNFIGLKAGK